MESPFKRHTFVAPTQRIAKAERREASMLNNYDESRGTSFHFISRCPILGFIAL
jgi:hypothetical protein